MAKERSVQPQIQQEHLGLPESNHQKRKTKITLPKRGVHPVDFILRAGERRKQKDTKETAEDIVNKTLPKLQKEIQGLSPEERQAALRKKTEEFKEKIKNSENKEVAMENLLPEAYAVVAVAAHEILNQMPYPVQIMGGIALHYGNIAEMKTGEGKTLTSTMPIYLNALTGEGVHVVTANDYLAKRDAAWMGQVYTYLGLTVGVILPNRPAAEHRAAYNCDITYGTKDQFGFDYLRDNMAWRKEDLLQRGHAFALVDEVDSILIDEARVPLIISGPVEGAIERNKTFAELIKQMKGAPEGTAIDTNDTKDDIHYEVDHAKKTVAVTAAGVAFIEEKLGIDNLYATINTPLIGYMNNALRAKELFQRDKDYIVANGEILIIDEFTGRIQHGRRYNEGMHQAIEAKEGVPIKQENQTLATITLQNYFRIYEKLSGMTGTAQTEAAEFNRVYNMDVISIPTNKPEKREDRQDVIYQTEEAKYIAVVEDIIERHQKGQPVLVGTISVKKSEILSSLLSKPEPFRNLLYDKTRELRETIKEIGDDALTTLLPYLETPSSYTPQDFVNLAESYLQYKERYKNLPDALDGIARTLQHIQTLQAEQPDKVSKTNRPKRVLNHKIRGLHRFIENSGDTSLQPLLAYLDKPETYTPEDFQRFAENYLQYQYLPTDLYGIARTLHTYQALQKGIPHKVLNAKYHAQEGEIIAQAGRQGAITIATNMAGRGTDIILGGNPEYLAAKHARKATEAAITRRIQELNKRGLPIKQSEIQELAQKIFRYEQRSLMKKYKRLTDKEAAKVRDVGGLYVIGTERHDSRRIDNQLRGRSGRQGDPGESRFYLSLQDDLLKRFRGNAIAKVMERLNIPEDVPIENGLVTRQIRSAQTQVEAINAEIRKDVLKYDEVMNKQRSVIYGDRRRVLEGEDMQEYVEHMIEEVVKAYIKGATPAKGDEWDLNSLYEAFTTLRTPSKTLDELKEKFGEHPTDDIANELKEEFLEDYLIAYEKKTEEIGEEAMRDKERQVILEVIDRKWREHLYEMDYLRDGVGLRAYAQRDPLVEYNREGFDMFEQMLEGFREETIRTLFQLTPETNSPRQIITPQTSS